MGYKVVSKSLHPKGWSPDHSKRELTTDWSITFNFAYALAISKQINTPRNYGFSKYLLKSFFSIDLCQQRLVEQFEATQ